MYEEGEEEKEDPSGQAIVSTLHPEQQISVDFGRGLAQEGISQHSALRAAKIPLILDKLDSFVNWSWLQLRRIRHAGVVRVRSQTVGVPRRGGFFFFWLLLYRSC